MTNYGMLRKDRETLIDFLDKYGEFDGSPWMNWFDKKYCKKCESIVGTCPELNNIEVKASWCEVYDGKCKYFPRNEFAPTNREIIDMWLDEEVE